MSNYCGIDFGTSNSTIGAKTQDGARLIGLEKNKTDMPTALFYNFDDDEFLFGRSAVNDYIEGEYGRFMRALKSTLGTPIMKQTTQIKANHYSFTQLISIYLKELKKRAEKSTGSSLENVVLGRPVHFVDEHPENDNTAQEQLKEAAIEAGFKHIEFQYEPIAAALDFEQVVEKETIALIADIGGGTSDFTVIKLSPNQTKLDRKGDILASTGVHIGGTDIDRTLNINEAMPLFGYKQTFNDVNMQVPAHYFHSLSTWHLINFLYTQDTEADFKNFRKRLDDTVPVERFLKVLNEKLGHYIAFQTEAAKIGLSDNEHSDIVLNTIEKELSKSVSKTVFDTLMAPYAKSIQETAIHCIKEASMNIEDIDALFLTGGTTSIPIIKDHLLAVCPNAQVIEGDKFGSVGTGLTLQAEKLFS